MGALEDYYSQIQPTANVGFQRRRYSGPEVDPLLGTTPGITFSDDQLIQIARQQYLQQQAARDQAIVQAANNQPRYNQPALIEGQVQQQGQPAPVSTASPAFAGEPVPVVVPVQGAKRWNVANMPDGSYDPNSQNPTYFVDDLKPSEADTKAVRRDVISAPAELPRLQTSPAVNQLLEQALQGVADPKDRALFRMAAEQSALKRQANMQAFQSKMAAIEQDRQEQHNQISAHVNELTPEQRAYGAVEHNIIKDRALTDWKAERDKIYLQSLTIDPKQQEAFLKQKNHDLDKKYEPYFQEFEKTKGYEDAVSQAKELQKVYLRVNTLRDHLDTVKEHLDAGDKDRATDLIKQTVNQELNSITNENALQIGELVNRYRSSLGVVDIAEAQGKNPVSSLGGWISAFMQASPSKKVEMANTEKGKGYFAQIAERVSANPVRAYELAKDQADGTINVLNNKARNIISATSPKIAKRNNVEIMPLIQPLNEQQQPQRPQQQSQQQYTPEQIKAARAALQALRASRQAQKPTQQAAIPVDYTGKEGF